MTTKPERLGPADGAPSRRVWAFILAAVLLGLVLARPRPARAYGLEGAKLVRLSALIAWKDGHEVLAVSPVVEDVSSGGRLVVPLPPGGRIVPVPPGWPLGAGRAGATGAGGDGIAAAGHPGGGASRDGGAGASPGRAGAVGPRTPRGRAGGRAPAVTLPRMAPPKVGFAEPTHVGFLPKEKLRGVPRAILAEEARRGWRFAVITLPEVPGRLRVGAVAFAFDATRLLLPLRLAEAIPAHTLDLTVLAAGPIPDLGGMDFALGLARAPGGPVPPALARWAHEQVGLVVPVRSDFAAPAVNGPLRPLMRYDGDLTLPPPRKPAPAAGGAADRMARGAAAGDVAGAEGAPGRAAGPPAGGAADRSGAAPDRGARPRAVPPPSPSGCGACASAGGGGGAPGDAAVLALAGLLALMTLKPRRRGAGLSHEPRR